MIFFIVFVCLVSGSVIVAWWKGGAPERIVASMFLIAWLVSVALYWGLPSYSRIDWIGPAMNGVMAVILFLVAQRANRRWPMLAASLQILLMAVQVVRHFRPEWMWQVYVLMVASWPYLQLIVLLVGTIFHWRREVGRGPEPSWSRS